MGFLTAKGGIESMEILATWGRNFQGVKNGFGFDLWMRIETRPT